MAKGFDSYSNGLFLGIVVGLLVEYTAGFSGSFLSFWGTWMSSASTWLLAQTWMSWATSFASYMDYILSALIGAIVGIYIDLN